MRLVLFTILAVALPIADARADTHSELLAALEGFTGETPARARVSFEYWNKAGEKDAMSEEGCTVSAGIDEGAAGLRITWDRGTIAAAVDEVRAASTDGDRTMPMRRAMGELNATLLSGYLNGRAELQRWLGQSELLKEESSVWKGAPATLLTYKNTPRANVQTRKYLKELLSTVKVWVGADGVPFAAERSVRFRGRAFLVVSFESSENNSYEYAVRGDRLVVTRHTQESQGSGTGGTAHQRTVATLAFAPE